ncbi:MAG TPA: SRPBCC domain-containing protein [Acidimicrobiales bacterium]|nr:SRPBCC domain-containing protein [Acidimicrobiales bacterium]
MTVTNVLKDLDALTVTVTAEFDASTERVWQLWEDPRQLERWWGPPTYPATFVDHDLTVGGRVTYFMTGPDGDQPRGIWRVVEVDKPRRLEIENGFADESGKLVVDAPLMIMRVALTERDAGGTRMTIETSFASRGDMDRVLTMGFEEGITAAMGQIDGIL